MLLPYATKARLADTSSTLRSLINSTTTGLVDTAAALRSNLATKVNYSDTASMLLPYATKARLADTSSTLRGLIASDNDKDSTNEKISAVTFVKDTLKIVEGSATKQVKIPTFVKATGKVSSSGTALKIMGATVSRINTGDYQITFTTAMPDAHYIIQLTVIDLGGSGNDAPSITYTSQSTTGFIVKTADNDNGGSDSADTDLEFMFTVIDF
jgi:hypothetical protein